MPFEPVRVDPTSPTPNLDLILGQLHALELGAVRRDALALAAAQSIDAVAEAPGVRALAAKVRWLSGDPAGLERIERSLAEAPRGAGVLADLVAPLRAAGLPDVARAVERAQRPLAAAAELQSDGAPLGRTGRIEQPLAPPGVLAALREIASWYPGRTRVWFVERQAGAATDPSVIRPAGFVVGSPVSGLTLRRDPDPAPGPVGEVARMVAAIWPVTRIVPVRDLDARQRAALRKGLTPL